MHINTPLIISDALSGVTKNNVWLKMDAAQPSGSFKLRGVGFACKEYAKRGATGFVSSSGGNAGIAAAYAGRVLGVPTKVFVPESTSAQAIKLLREQQAEVTVHGASWVEANAKALEVKTETDAFIHPFDDALIWQGHASLIDEVAASGNKPDAVMLSVGGGGLFSGIVLGLQQNGWHDVPVIAVETQGAASFSNSIENGECVTLKEIDTIATSLGAKKICEKSFTLAQEHPTISIKVSDAAAIASCCRFMDDHRTIVEPACGAALAPAYTNAPEVAEFKNLLVVVCGGATATVAQLLRWKAELQI